MVARPRCSRHGVKRMSVVALMGAATITFSTLTSTVSYVPLLGRGEKHLRPEAERLRIAGDKREKHAAAKAGRRAALQLPGLTLAGGTSAFAASLDATKVTRYTVTVKAQGLSMPVTLQIHPEWAPAGFRALSRRFDVGIPDFSAVSDVKFTYGEPKASDGGEDSSGPPIRDIVGAFSDRPLVPVERGSLIITCRDGSNGVSLFYLSAYADFWDHYEFAACGKVVGGYAWLDRVGQSFKIEDGRARKWTIFGVSLCSC